ncbi:MAG: hypothetical protein A07HR60_02582 [uncultured archaeon A07HR60]|nr:MAG: hypothetical protein A07HR60_02582 [uncultured archaeon A07HR60]
MRELDEMIISCAVTGAIHTPTMSPHLPVTPEEIADEAIAAANAGASIVHIHVRDPDTGEPVTDVDLFRDVAERVHDACNAIVQPTTGGRPSQTPEERVVVVPELEPEMASCNMGSMNFGLYQLLDKHDDWEYAWEPEYLDNTRDLIFQNTFEDIETVLPIFTDHGTMPELECYDVGHLSTAKHFVERGLIEPPIHLQFVTGIHGGIGATPANLTHMVETAERLFGDEYSFSVIGAGRHEFPLGMQALSMGGHARVGLEDNLYLGPGELASSNVDLVEKIARLGRELVGREPASPGTVREFLNLKGGDQTSLG